MEALRGSRGATRALAWAGLVTMLVTTSSAFAADAPGGPALRQARAAWDRGSLDTAEPLYREALEKGGLAPNEVLEGYVRLGSIRASLGKKDQAIAAFRAASILDTSFAVPTEAGPKGPALADRAKRDTAKIGSIQVGITAPKESASGKAFRVSATLDKPHIPIVSKVELVTKDGTTGKETVSESKPEESMDFEVPSDITLPGASLIVRVDALDGHQNRLASAEAHVKIPDSGGAVVATKPSGGESGASEVTPPPSGDPSTRKGGGFWSSPWPYLIGGLAIAGAGTAVYFGTRPPEDVSVGQVGVRTR